MTDSRHLGTRGTEGTLLILALDTTTRGGSVAVLDDDRVLAVVRGDQSRTHGERLPGEMATALADAGIPRDKVDLLAVATGPGAFTGLRIGLAAMQGLSMTLARPVIGVSALDALLEQAAGSDAELIVPWMDAQRGDVFATLIERSPRTVIRPPIAANPSVLLTEWKPLLAHRSAIFIGDAASRDAAVIATHAAGRTDVRAPEPLAPQIARLAWRKALNGDAGAPHGLEPIYVRRPDAEIERERRGRP